MMRSNIILPVVLASLSLFVFSDTAFSQGKSGAAKTRNYGIGHPKSEQDLPYGQLRKQIEGLPPKARGKALGWLQSFSFPAEDVRALKVNKKGEVSYADNFLPDETQGLDSNGLEFASGDIDAARVFQLHSRPGSSNVVYLDFDGHVLEDNVWNYYLDARLVALPFDPSNNDNPATEANFTQDELNRIFQIWHRIAEDYAAFDIDVTTEEPLDFTSTTGRILFTHDTDADGKKMPSQGAGGVAYVNVFGWSNYGSYYSPALVYYTNLFTDDHGYPTLVAEAGSHELGHNLGLSHDGIQDGVTYYRGHGSGLVSWAPIMGSSYSRNVTQWSKGEYPNANNQQDDLAIMAEHLGYVGDDHGNSASQASALVVEENGDILVSSPELDPDNLLPANKGVIDDEGDVDWFYIDIAGPGTLEINAVPAWHSFTRIDRRGANLDIELSIFDDMLNMVDFSDPADDTSATVTATVDAGRYYVQVDGVGNQTNSSYGDYASTGMFFLEGNISSGGTPPPSGDSTPPAPSQMSWESPPAATGTSTVVMTAVLATDESGGVQYKFSCVVGGIECPDSEWQDNRSYTASGLESNTYYAFKVTARDVHGNENGSSDTMGATTDSEPPPPGPDDTNEPPNAVATYSPYPAVITKGNSVDVTLDGTGSNDPDGSITSWTWTTPNGEVKGTGQRLTLRLREGSHTYTLTVADNDGAEATNTVVVAVSKPGDEGGNKGKKPPK